MDFPHTKRLQEIVQSHHWALCDATAPKGRKIPFTIEELDVLPPARQFKNKHNYIFLPLRTKGQTLRDAYFRVQGVGPAIVLDSLGDHADLNGEGAWVREGRLVYPFSRIHFHGKMTMCAYPETTALAHPPLLFIPYHSVIAKFEKHFRILTSDELNQCSRPLQPSEMFK